MKDQEESPGKNGSEEVPALHGMMGCVRHSSVSGSMCALNVVYSDHRKPMCNLGFSHTEVKHEDKK